MTSRPGQTVCSHNVSTDLPCVACRLDLAYQRLEALKGDKTRAASYERLMHERDIKLLTEMLASGKITL